MSYNLYSTDRVFRDETLISYYFQPNKKIIKKCKPIDIHGERVRLNLETGELMNYKKKEVLASHHNSLRRTVILMNMLLSMNDFDWFWTLTFDKEKIDRTNDEEVFNCYKKYIDNLKHKYPSFRYMCFPERHEDNCFHFHLLVGGLTVKQMGLVDSGKVCCSWAKQKGGIASKSYYEKTKDKYLRKETDGEPIYNVCSFVYGYTTASRIVSRERCNSYVKKYVEKALGSTDFFKKRFYYSKNLNVPDVVKRLIGADFESPEDISSLEILTNNPLFIHAKGDPYVSDYNVMQIKIDNSIKDVILRDYVPCECKTPFDGGKNE